MNGPILEIDALDVRTEDGIRLLQAVELRIAPGERVGLIGESGSGKSLTALSVMGLLAEGLRAEGSIRLAGNEIVGRPEREIASRRGAVAAMVFQEPMSALNPLMRVGDQVAEALLLHTPVSKAAARNRAVELLTLVELPDPTTTARAYPFQLSGGQRQRVVLAIALAANPRLLICDEPTTALDVTVQAKMLALINRLVDEVASALLFITHDLAVMASLCERVVVMYGGRVVEDGPVTAVLGAPRHHYTAGLLLASEATALASPGSRLPTIPGTVPPAGLFPSGCVFRTRCPAADDACTSTPPLTGSGHRVACVRPLTPGAVVDVTPDGFAP